jgi:hypothetical protein
MSMATLTRPTTAGNAFVEHLHPYYPYRSGKFDRASGRILDFKEGQAPAIRHYVSALHDEIPGDAVLAVVPPHAPGPAGPVAEMACRLAQRNERVDATGCLVRHTRIRKLSRGGRRHVQVHLDSVRVDDAHLIRGRRVTLLDDVTTTGNSLRACKQLLLGAGAQSVRCIALAKTTR